MAAAFFQRFRFKDVAEIERAIAAQQAKLAEAVAAGDVMGELAAKSWLGYALTPLDRQAEATVLLESALVLARRFGDKLEEIRVLLNLATARQYLGEHDLAQRHFRLALQRCRAIEGNVGEDQILHHQGRCFVEQGDLNAARECFVQALALREARGATEQVESTRRALVALDAMQGAS